MKAILILVVALIASISAVEDPDAGIFYEEGTLIEVTGMTPTWGSIHGNELIVITGCHFSTYSEVTCMFDQWGSINAMIVSDSEIHCWTPTNVEFRTVPKDTYLYLLFDGTRGKSELAVDWFHWGPHIETVSPTQDYVAGGETLTLSGWGFSDYNAVEVYLDDTPCTGVSYGENQITCTIPAGEFNQNAVIDVYFDENPYYFLHAVNSLHYGPILEMIDPTCGRVNGGDTITFTGSLFDDPSLDHPRAEFFINGEWIQVDGVHSGNEVRVVTPFGADYGDDVVIELFGNPDEGPEESYSKVPGVTSFHYGPLVFTVSPTVGYVLEDTITITGCAFFNYTDADFEILIGGVDPCLDAIDLNEATNTITCTTDAHACTFTNQQVVVEVNDEGTTKTVPNHDGIQKNWWWGPYMFDDEIEPARGPYTVATEVTLQGYKLARSADTPFDDPQCNWDLTAGASNVKTDADVSNGNTIVKCDTPVHEFDEDGTVDMVFGNECTNETPQNSDFHYGPYCLSISPTFGYIGGGTSVTVTGEGFTDVDWEDRDMQIRFCTGPEECVWESDADNGPFDFPGQDRFVAVTPDFRLAPRNEIGGNRVFGDVAEVYIFFGVENGSPSNETMFQQCPNFRWGPIVTDIDPKKGPMGPRGDREEGPWTPVTITGAGFADPLVSDNIRVSFGEIHGADAATTSDTTITVYTLWGGAQSNTNHDVFVYFDTCNTTVSDEEWMWGPEITDIEPIWGFHGRDNNKEVTIYGDRFDDETWCNYQPGNSQRWDCRVECYIDQHHMGEVIEVWDGSDNLLYFICEVPERDFGTRAEVELRFGMTPYGDIDGDGATDFDNDCVSEHDYNSRLIADEQIWYRPNVTCITPQIGEVIGGQTITVHGYGLGGWDNYRCFVGEYEGTVTNEAALIAGDNTDDLDLNCQAPTRRYDFGEDAIVSVFVGLSSEEDTEDQVMWFEKVWSEECLFHFGPWCYDGVSGPNPSLGDLSPDDAFDTVITGTFWFNDDFLDDSEPIVQWITPDGEVYNVTVENFSGNTIRVSNLPDAEECGQIDEIQIWWDIPEQVISCGTFMHNPWVDEDTTPELGWHGTDVSITGVGFTDPQIYVDDVNIAVTVGGDDAYEYTISDTRIKFKVPPHTWQSDQVIKVEWSSQTGAETEIECEYTLDTFHYGPILTHITPTFGYVEGDTDYTVHGEGFTCCGLEDTVKCRMDGDDEEGTSTVNTDSTIVCTSFIRTINSAANLEDDVTIGIKFNTTETNKILDADYAGEDIIFHYGPFFDALAPNNGVIEGDTLLTISGHGFQDPFFIDTDFECVFSNDRDDEERTDATVNSDSSITCRTPIHMRYCNEVDTVLVAVPLEINAEVLYPKATDASIEDFYHIYAPIITSISKTQGYLPGGESVTINFSPALTDFKNVEVRVLFANIEVQPVTEYMTGASTSQLTVESPAGPFWHSGPISVILDFKNDALTTLDLAWHWHPFITEVSHSWSLENGGETIVLYGGGFCNYDTVLCSFGGLEADQSDIAFDDRLICHTPYRSSGPASVGLTATFCDDQDDDDDEFDMQDEDRETDCDCNYMGTPDMVGAGSHDFVGISSISPTSGPYVGGTTVTIDGLGFTKFAKVECLFGDLPAVEINGNTTTDGQVDCVSPDAGDAMIVPFRLKLTYTLDDGATYIDYLPALSERPLFFEYGRPYITSISPTDQDLDEDTIITLTGRYFNGGDLLNIKCIYTWADGSQTDFAAVSKTDTEVVCGPVSKYPDVPSITVAAVTVSFDNGDEESNMVSYEYTQNPSADTISPDNGGKYGGTTVEISGDNLHGGISYLCRFGEIIVGAEYDETDDVIRCKSPATEFDEEDLPRSVDVFFSINGGVDDFIPVTGEAFEYEDSGNFNDDGASDSQSSAGALMFSAAILIVSVVLSIVF